MIQTRSGSTANRLRTTSIATVDSQFHGLSQINIDFPDLCVRSGMVHAINCGADGAPNSFTNFKNAALAVGASLSAAAPPSSTAPPSTTYTADYGTATIPPPETPLVVTETVTVQESVWTTTYSSYPNSPAPTPVSLTGNIINVVVGGAGGNVTFTPSRISAQPRDTVVFTL
jgi:hypothetical protein